MLQKKDEHTAYCPTCDVSFSLASKGKSDIDQHLNSEKHRRRVRDSASSSKVPSFFAPKFTKLDDQISAAEGTLAFHTVKHHFSFNSVDCSHKLLQTILPDSQIAKKISCARTKTEAIVVNVLAPLSIEFMLADVAQTSFISISTDASNHGSTKMFPILLQYFTIQSGLQIKLLDIQSLKNETSESITDMLTLALQQNNLNAKCIAFSGDNCNTNFGGKKRAGSNNVFARLKAQGNKQLIGIGCPAHILHNAARFGFEALHIDFESVIERVFNYFSIYTIRTEKLKEFANFVEVEYRPLLHHSKTRWLSLLPCIHRFLEMYDALKSLFLSDESFPKVISTFFEKEINEAYLWFLHSLMSLFDSKIKNVERENNSVVETLTHLNRLKTELRNRISEEFIPMKVRAILHKCIENGECNEVQVAKKSLLNIYTRCLSYLDEWTQSLQEFQCFDWMSMNNAPTWEDIQPSLTYLTEKCVLLDESKLFDQFCCVKTFISSNTTDDFNTLLLHQKWSQFFQEFKLIEQNSEIKKIAEFFFAIPAHNANIERIFSLIGSQWTNERNRLTFENMRAILFTQYNFKSFKCTEFYNFLQTKPAVLRKISSNEKYV